MTTDKRIAIAAILFGVVMVGSAVATAALAQPSVLPRATADRQDDVAGPQVHILYVVPRDGEDRALDTNGVLVRSVGAWQRWLQGQTNGVGLRLDTYQGELDVSFFRLATNDAVVAARREFVREQIEEEIYAAGFNSPTKVYAVYYDGSSNWSCGGGDPEPAFRGAVAAVYLKGTPPNSGPCIAHAPGGDPPSYMDFAMIHEIVHTLGFVPQCAPNSRRDYGDAGHVGDSRYDLMWSGPEPWGTNEPHLMQLDVGRNDYYGHGRSDCRDLAQNPYLTSSQPDPDPDPEPDPEVEAPAVASFTTTASARAGRPFAATLRIDVRVGRGTCVGRLGNRRLRATKALGAKSVRCVWRLPRTARGKRLVGSVTATSAGGDAVRTFSRRVR